MDLASGADGSTFAFGVAFGVLLLCLVFTLGIWVGRWSVLWRDPLAIDRVEVQGLLKELFRWTSGVESDVSHYRELLDRLSTQCDPRKFKPGERGLEVTDLLQQIVKANYELQDRLDKAEHVLQGQAEEISAYMCEARTDSLTGLANRRAFNDELGRQLAEWRRHQTPVCVLILDIDHFKSFNDRYGHLAGDKVLEGVAKVIRETTRESALTARLGGEEFAVVLCGADALEACEAAERIRQAVEQAVFKYDKRSLNVTISGGVAQAQSSEVASMLVRRADDALYASKAAGRNVVHWHDGRRCLLLSPRAVRSGRMASTSDRVTAVDGELAATCDSLRQRLLEVAGERAGRVDGAM